MRTFLQRCTALQKAGNSPAIDHYARPFMTMHIARRFNWNESKSRRNTTNSHKSNKGGITPTYSPRDLSPRAIKSFDRNLPYSGTKLKAWEKEGMSKDQYFGRRYGRMNETQKQKYNDRVRKERESRKQKYNESDGERSNYSDSYDSQHRTKERSTPVEYVFGTHAVRLVLHARARKFFGTLHTYRCKDLELINWARNTMGLKVVEATRPQLLKTLAGGGVHNGIVLETGPLVHPEIHSLGPCQDGIFNVLVYHQLEDSIANIEKKVRRGTEKFPLGLFLDGITDPQNLGGIARSAFFFGADFLVVPDENSARMGPVALKASAGALDLLPIYTVSQAVKFLARVQGNGWNVVASGVADSPEAPIATLRKERNVEAATANKVVLSEELGDMLEQCPMLLVMGSEGKGVSREIRTKADFIVSIDKQIEGDEYVDSLNVNVAAGVILSKCVN